MGNPVVSFEIGAKDINKVRSFFSDLFGWKISDNPHYNEVNTGGKGGIHGGIHPVDSNQPGYVTFYVEVDDLKAYLEKAEKLGGKTVVPPVTIPDGDSFAVFADPEGHNIGLYKKKG